MTANRDALLRVARALGPELQNLVFVGGRLVELYLTEPVLPRVRPTDDADAIYRADGYVAHGALEDRLRNLGFTHDTSSGAPACRWVFDDEKIDIMPYDLPALGFNNRWYSHGYETAIEVPLTDDLTIRILAPSVFVADKLTAYEDRGAEDPLVSQDLEDIIAVFAGRPEIVDELVEETEELRDWVSRRITQLFFTGSGEDLIAAYIGHTANAAKIVENVIDRLRVIANLEASN